MANRQGKERDRSDASIDEDEFEDLGSARGSSVPEFVRRALSMGFSGFFMTEEAVRRALGDTLPKDWIDFAVDQSQRTRQDFVERLTYEIGQTLERADLANVLSELLEGRTLEVKAQIRLGPRGAETHDSDVSFAAEDAEEEPSDRDGG
jgi:hypothetical protein